MHVNTPFYTAAVAMDYLRQQEIEPIAWPTFSPDLNPIKLVWSAMKEMRVLDI